MTITSSQTGRFPEVSFLLLRRSRFVCVAGFGRNPPAVASRNSSSRFKGQRVDVQAAGRELGVRFLVEGSVRRLGERIRITAQLIDAQTGNQVRSGPNATIVRWQISSPCRTRLCEQSSEPWSAVCM